MIKRWRYIRSIVQRPTALRPGPRRGSYKPSRAVRSEGGGRNWRWRREEVKGSSSRRRKSGRGAVATAAFWTMELEVMWSSSCGWGQRAEVKGEQSSVSQWYRVALENLLECVLGHADMYACWQENSWDCMNMNIINTKSLYVYIYIWHIDFFEFIFLIT